MMLHPSFSSCHSNCCPLLGANSPANPFPPSPLARRHCSPHTHQHTHTTQHSIILPFVAMSRSPLSSYLSVHERVLDTYRVLSSVCIVCLHSFQFSSLHYSPNSHVWNYYNHHVVMIFITQLFHYGVDVFFLLSGYLCTKSLIKRYHTIQQQQQQLQAVHIQQHTAVNKCVSTSFPYFDIYWYLQFLCHRYMRLVPVLLVVIALNVCLGIDESITMAQFIWKILLHLLLIQNFSTQYFICYVGVSWSMATDFQFYCVWPLCFHLLWKYQQRVSPYLIMAILYMACFIAPALAFDVKYCNFIALASKLHASYWISPQQVTYIQSLVDYPITAIGRDVQQFIDTLYLPLVCRYCPFLIGATIAMYLYHYHLQQEQHNNDDNRTNTSNGAVSSSFFTSTFSTVISVCCLLFVLAPGVSPRPVDPVETLSITTQFLLTTCIRQLSITCIGWLIFTSMRQQTHTHTCHWFYALLQHPIFARLAPYTFCIYLIHFRILFLSIFFIPIFKTLALDAPVCCSLLLFIFTVIVSGICAVPLYHFVELKGKVVGDSICRLLLSSPKVKPL